METWDAAILRDQAMDVPATTRLVDDTLHKKDSRSGILRSALIKSAEVFPIWNSGRSAIKSTP
ncbi:MAG: hypothetical protein Q7J57_14355 [Gemmobacter sp.]|nr:hypothetical protein [Gemmobacter sp.]